MIDTILFSIMHEKQKCAKDQMLAMSLALNKYQE